MNLYLVKHIVTILLILINLSYVCSQNEILKDSTFLKIQTNEYQTWLDSVGLNKWLKFSMFNLNQNKLNVVLHPADQINDCNSFKYNWQVLTDSFNFQNRYKQSLPETLIEILSDLTGLHIDSLEVVIECPNSDQFNVTITGTKLGRVIVKYNSIEKHGAGNFSVVPLSWKNINTGERVDSLTRHTTCSQVKNMIGKYLLNHFYKGKGTNILYNFKCDTSKSYYNQFSWEFTHINNEALKDLGYFEYHKITIEVNDRNNVIDVNWHFVGKFGSGILFPPKNHNYKLMSIYYPNEEKEYEIFLFKKVLEYLNKELIKY